MYLHLVRTIQADVAEPVSAPNVNAMNNNRRAPIGIRLLIWLFAAVVGFTGISASGLAASSEQPSSSSESALSSPAINTQAFVAATSAAGCNPANPDPFKMGTAVTDASVNQACVSLLVDKLCPLGSDPSKGSTADTCDPDHFLPSKRWQDQLDSILAATKGGFLSMDALTTNFTMFIGHFLMGIAAFLWGLIHELAAWISSMALLSGEVGGHITRVFASMANVLTSSGLLAILIFVTALVLIRQVLRIRGGGMPSGLIGTMMTVLLPLGVLFAMATAASQSVTETEDGIKSNDRDPSQVFMSPVWLAQKGIYAAELPSAAIARGLSDTNPAFGGDKLANPSCAAYTEVLKAAYKEAWARKHPTNALSSSLTVVVDGLFNEAFMTFYNDGQFQNSYSGQRIVCHLLDGFSGISPAEQAIIGAAAHYPPGANASEAKSAYLGAAPGNIDPRYFAPYTNLDADMSVDDKRKFVLGWAACAYKGGPATADSSWAIDPAWYWGSRSWEGSGGLDAAGTAADKDAIGGYGCRRFWNDPYLVNYDTYDNGNDASPALKGDNFRALRFKNAPNGALRGAKSDPTIIAKYEASVKSGVCGSNTCIPKEFGVESLSGFSKTVLVTKGELGSWIFSALMALVASLMYSYVLVGMFGGLLLAKVGFTVLLAASPGILFLLALPSTSGRKNSRGMKLLRMLIGWMVATAVLSALVMVFALFISMIRNFLGGSNGGFFFVISPAISLVLMHFLMKAVGMAGLISPTGSMGFALGAAKAASSGNMADFKKGQSAPTNFAKKKLDSRMQKRDRRERMRNAAAKEGKSLKELRKDSDWARKNRAGDLGERFHDMRAARKGVKDFEGTSRRARSTAAKAAKADGFADKKEDAALKGLEDGAAVGKEGRDDRNAARREDAASADLLNKVNGATAGNRDAANSVEDVLSDLDTLTETASSVGEANMRTIRGTAVGTRAVATAHLSAAESEATSSAMASLVSLDKDGSETRKMVAEGQAVATGLVSSTGGALLTESGAVATGFSVGTSGAVLAPGTGAFQLVVAQMNADRAAGDYSDVVTVAGQEYHLSDSVVHSMGIEGMQAAASVVASDYGIDPSAVLVSRTGSMVTLAPATGALAYEGTGMAMAATASQQIEVARNVTQWLPPTVREEISRLPASGQAAAIEFIAHAYSDGGQPVDALALLKIDESKVIAAHSDPAKMAALTERTIDIPDGLLRHALSAGAAASSVVTLSAAHTSAAFDLGHRGGTAMKNADVHVEKILATMQTQYSPEAMKTNPPTEASAKECIETITKALSEITVVRSAAATASGAVSGEGIRARETVHGVIEAQREIIVKINDDFAAAQALPDNAARQSKIADVVKAASEQVVTLHRIAERDHDASTEKVIASVGGSGSRGARREERGVLSEAAALASAEVGVSARRAIGLPGRINSKMIWSD
jgi:hypothetical protein